MTELYYDDFAVGEVLTTDAHTVTREEAVGFASLYDPQAQHVDEAAAVGTLFGTLIVSGWHTAAITMRLKLTTKLGQVAGGIVGVGMENIRWPKAVLPGDTLSARITVKTKRHSNSMQGKGVVSYLVETLNQQEEKVLEMTITVIMPLQPTT